MLSKAKCLSIFLLVIILFTSCGSYLNIEKRIYLDGFHVEQNFFPKSGDTKADFQQRKNSKTIKSYVGHYFELSANQSTTSSVNNNEVKNVLISNNTIHHSKIVFSEDTLKKKKLKKKDDVSKFDEKKDITKGERKTNLFAIAGLVISILAILIPALAIISLMLSLFALWRIKKRPEKFDGRVLAIVGLFVSIFWIGIGLYILLL